MSNTNTLLLTNEIGVSPSGGREMLCKLNHDVLKQLYGNNCCVYQLEKQAILGVSSIVKAFIGHIDGLNSKTISEILQLIKNKSITKIFIDGSNFGGITKLIKRQFPQVKIFTFFHNVESRFFLGSFKQNKSMRALAVLIVNYLAERKSVKYSDKIICINGRDSQLLNKVYGKKATDLYPMSLEDKLPSNYASLPILVKEKYALFVGGTFYANQAGILWFVKNVAPFIEIKTYIVGRGFEKFRDKLELHENVVVIGEVESLAQWYHDAYVVIAPIFDGSGMKTKVAEALMYGKKVIGTPESFSGYSEILDKAGYECSSANEFVMAINSLSCNKVESFDPELRKIFEQKYSNSAAKARIDLIMSN